MSYACHSEAPAEESLLRDPLVAPLHQGDGAH